MREKFNSNLSRILNCFNKTSRTKQWTLSKSTKAIKKKAVAPVPLTRTSINQSSPTNGTEQLSEVLTTKTYHLPKCNRCHPALQLHKINKKRKREKIFWEIRAGICGIQEMRELLGRRVVFSRLFHK